MVCMHWVENRHSGVCADASIVVVYIIPRSNYDAGQI